MNREKRVFEVFKEGKWEEIDILDLKEGDKFRIFDAGKPYKDLYNKDEWICNGEHGVTDNNIKYVGTLG